jgi:endoribonuclease Dicer
VPQKALSDCMEALLGAGWCSGGLQTALEVGTALGLAFGGTKPWHLRPIPPRPAIAGANYKSFEALEERLGHSFKDKTLMAEASVMREAYAQRSYAHRLTHQSCNVLDSMPAAYERIEYLGDALVDVCPTVASQT